VRPRHRGREDQASRPTAKGGWDLDLGLIRDDLAEEDVVALECPFPRLAARLTAKPGPGSAVPNAQARGDHQAE
jgi:hypothetical protein